MRLWIEYSLSCTLVVSMLAMASGCSTIDAFQAESTPSSPAAASPIASSQPSASSSPAAAPSSPATTIATTSTAAMQADAYQRAIDKGFSAATLAQTAQSQDDWQLVARRWQQAIDLLAAVGNADPHHGDAQRKLTEYRRNLAYADQQSSRSTVAANPDGRIVVRSSEPAPAPPPDAPVAAPAPTNSGRTFFAPIIRREGNTPVIRVTFNGSQTYDMIVDTGASGTLITPQMAQALSVTPVATALVDTASERGVTVPLGYVGSIEVDGAIASNVLVAIAGPELGTGLLGHDFFGDYDLILREDAIEFRER